MDTSSDSDRIRKHGADYPYARKQIVSLCPVSFLLADHSTSILSITDGPQAATLVSIHGFFWIACERKLKV